MPESSSSFYLGEQGQNYFAYQNKDADAAARIELFKFRPYISAQDSVLDFGCGGGWILRALQPVRAAGVEINPAARAVCEAHGTLVYPTLDAVPEATFTRIISHHCLEHVPFPIETLKALHQRLETDGRLILVLPVDDWRRQHDFTGTDKDHHLHTWTPRLIANTLSEAGFTCLEARILTHAFPRFWRPLSRLLPGFLFDLACRFWAIGSKRRQLLAVARKSSPQPHSPTA